MRQRVVLLGVRNRRLSLVLRHLLVVLLHGGLARRQLLLQRHALIAARARQVIRGIGQLILIQLQLRLRQIKIAATVPARCSLLRQLRDSLLVALHRRLQIVHALPRDESGNVRNEILQLVAMNQIDLIEPLMRNDADRLFMKDILDRRKNLRDRFSF